MRQMPNLRALQIFEAAGRLSSFLHAAKELSITPSAVSHQIRSLEDELGVLLFHRVSRSVVLTDAGQHYLERVEQAFGRIEAASQTVGRMSTGDVLTISTAPSLAAQWLFPRIWSFTEKHADIDIRIQATGALITDLRGGSIDVDIRYGSILREAATITHPFPLEQIVVLCSPSLISGSTPLETPTDLQNHTLIHSEVNLFRWTHWIERYSPAQFHVDRGPRFDRSFMSIRAAVEGRGVCLESRLLVERELSEGSLVMPFDDLGPQIECHHLTYLRSRVQIPKIKAFKTWLMLELDASATRSAGSHLLEARQG